MYTHDNASSLHKFDAPCPNCSALDVWHHHNTVEKRHTTAPTTSDLHSQYQEKFSPHAAAIVDIRKDWMADPRSNSYAGYHIVEQKWVEFTGNNMTHLTNLQKSHGDVRPVDWSGM